LDSIEDGIKQCLEKCPIDIVSSDRISIVGDEIDTVKLELELNGAGNVNE
jgi:hypothetical protein